MTAATYDRRTIRLHWATAGLVVLLWGLAQVIDLFPRGAPRIATRSTHIVLGLALGLLLVARLAWRAGSGRRLPPANSGLAGSLTSFVHGSLYAGLSAVVLLGITNGLARGDSIYTLFSVPKLFSGLPRVKPTIEVLHRYLANALLLVAAAHAIAAFVHHFILHDGVLRRMLPDDKSGPA